jgi:hypothetical protein
MMDRPKFLVIWLAILVRCTTVHSENPKPEKADMSIRGSGKACIFTQRKEPRRIGRYCLCPETRACGGLP